MKIAMVGLGRMGMNMARRLLMGHHDVVAFNRTKNKTEEMVKEGAVGAFSLETMVLELPLPRIVWLMLPEGRVVDDHIRQFADLLAPGDIVVDGGNTYYKDDIRRAELLSKRNIHFLDVGVSGGIWGLKKGYCLMIGGRKDIGDYLEPVFKSLAPAGGYLYCGPTGAGHFLKMVHNGIEYGMMQAYGEGFQILEASQYSQAFDFASIAHLWNQGSVVRSWLLELLESAFSKEDRLSGISGYVEDSGEGRWTVQQAMDTNVSAPVITLSLMQRYRSREKDQFSDKVVAALRQKFGGHAVKTSDVL
ncbi:putative 6-phosphogluconate dehydrogenase YqeC [uncultured Desulfobacterium sp.]|uniref:Putative 6-phosphogluconate dehydrogenase YqeC n=1 Tax=uncultured Desulfobacterium sp. TaxID=201089 RepID=A0A445MYR2_9BACT|nr:putative 6-phosphogluconate dehydrogenase YqeC [uncultured Desulfobacterium sp.]